MATQTFSRTLPSTQQLLVMGGDARIDLDKIRGVNRYGCRPFADPDLLDFGSSTASVISSAAFQAAEQLRSKLVIELQEFSHAALYARELARMRVALLSLCDLEGPAKPDIVFAASGTDLHRIAAHLAHAASTRPVLAIMVDETETGSGVRAAIINSRFATKVAAVALREANGTPRAIEQIDADFERLARHAVVEGFHVLLIQTDVSKTGTIAPSYACTAVLQQTLGKQLDVLIDACQFRISPATLHACLARGYSVALTGSKFIGGPCFSGALLIPAETASRLREIPFPKELASCTAAAEWPSGWSIPGMLETCSNFGLLLRWEAALRELRTFRSLADEDITRFATAFALSVRQRLENDPMLSSVPVPELNRSVLNIQSGWDTIQTIFPFQIYRSGRSQRHLLDTAEMQNVYRHLSHTDPRCQLGQPVNYGTEKHALRLCLSSRLIVQATQDGDVSSQHIIKQAHSLLDRAIDWANCGTFENSRHEKHIESAQASAATVR
jgi:hypothetical protein